MAIPQNDSAVKYIIKLKLNPTFAIKLKCAGKGMIPVEKEKSLQMTSTCFGKSFILNSLLGFFHSK
jgi:hypothetical protein